MNLHQRALVLAAACLPLVACGSSVSSTPSTTSTTVVPVGDAAVQVIANGCRHAAVHGAGLMVAPGRIATVAHVVAGAKTIQVRGAAGTRDATVVYIDPVLDLAVLKVDPALAPPIPIGVATAGDQGSVIVYRDDAPVELKAGIDRRVDIRTADIYGQGTHIRPGYELNLDIQVGDSGAVVVVGGKAVALVWAKSRTADARAWAMRASLLTDHLTSDAPVGNGQCT